MTFFGGGDDKLMPIFLKFLWSMEEVQGMFLVSYSVVYF
jgi:hypothetical protein